MKPIFSKCVALSFITIVATLSSCSKSKETTNAANDLVNSPVGFWTTEDSKLGQIGWRLSDKDFKKCIIALDTKITEQGGSINIDGNQVKYIYDDTTEELTATYNSDDKTLTEDQGLQLKYVRADDSKVADYNNKGCHL